jgi:hypothetical protein
VYWVESITQQNISDCLRVALEVEGLEDQSPEFKRAALTQLDEIYNSGYPRSELKRVAKTQPPEILDSTKNYFNTPKGFRDHLRLLRLKHCLGGDEERAELDELITKMLNSGQAKPQIVRQMKVIGFTPEEIFIVLRNTKCEESQISEFSLNEVWQAILNLYPNDENKQNAAWKELANAGIDLSKSTTITANTIGLLENGGPSILGVLKQFRQDKYALEAMLNGGFNSVELVRLLLAQKAKISDIFRMMTSLEITQLSADLTCSIIKFDFYAVIGLLVKNGAPAEKLYELVPAKTSAEKPRAFVRHLAISRCEKEVIEGVLTELEQYGKIIKEEKDEAQKYLDAIFQEKPVGMKARTKKETVEGESLEQRRDRLVKLGEYRSGMKFHSEEEKKLSEKFYIAVSLNAGEDTADAEDRHWERARSRALEKCVKKRMDDFRRRKFDEYVDEEGSLDERQGLDRYGFVREDATLDLRERFAKVAATDYPLDKTQEVKGEDKKSPGVKSTKRVKFSFAKTAKTSDVASDTSLVGECSSREDVLTNIVNKYTIYKYTNKSGVTTASDNVTEIFEELINHSNNYTLTEIMHAMLNAKTPIPVKRILRVMLNFKILDDKITAEERANNTAMIITAFAENGFTLIQDGTSWTWDDPLLEVRQLFS